MKARRSKGENVEKQNFGKVLYLVFILPCTELANLLVKTRNLRLFRNSDTTKRWPGNTGNNYNGPWFIEHSQLITMQSSIVTMPVKCQCSPNHGQTGHPLIFQASY